MTAEVVLLERAETVSPFTTRLTELPKWVASERGDYWHIPRTGHAHETGSLLVGCWCGIGLGTAGVRFLDRRPPGMICGTCDGRYDGARETNDTIFQPRRDPWRLPNWCPSYTADENGLCVACGERVRYRMYGACQHRPGELFGERVRPCPDHGYKWCADRDGRIVCLRHVGYGWGTCDFPMT